MKFRIEDLNTFHHNDEGAQQNEEQKNKIEKFPKPGIREKNNTVDLTFPFCSLRYEVMFLFHRFIND